MKALARRIGVLELKIRPNKAGNNLDREIAVMTACERHILRDFLMFIKNGGHPREAQFELLRQAAERAVNAARQRISKAL